MSLRVRLCRALGWLTAALTPHVDHEERPADIVLVWNDGQRIVFHDVGRIEVEGCYFAPAGLRMLVRSDGEAFHACRVGSSLQLHFMRLSRAELERLAARIDGRPTDFSPSPFVPPIRGGGEPS